MNRCWALLQFDITELEYKAQHLFTKPKVVVYICNYWNKVLTFLNNLKKAFAVYSVTKVKDEQTNRNNFKKEL